MGLGVLPAGLMQLTFGWKFNQPVGLGVLPAGLTQLTFGWNFNQPVGLGVLPAGLTHVTHRGKVFSRDEFEAREGI